MRKYFSYPLLFLFLAASIGLFLRWQFIQPTPGIRFAWFVHSHSHVMFLGWVFNVLYLFSVETYLPAQVRKPFVTLFWILSALVVAMMVAFPIQGYATYSIIFSTLHTLAAMGFVIVFLLRTRGQPQVSLWFARIAWFFFFISTAGPFSLGYLMANGLGQSIWYEYAIYYYLHFQYNGFFIFGIFSLFYQLLEQKQIVFDTRRARMFGVMTAIACIPAYALSVLFAKPGLIVHLIGALAAALQLVALFVFVNHLLPLMTQIRSGFNRTVRIIFLLTFLALILKLLLQLVSAHPVVANMAYEFRPIVIAYLHLVLVGIITLFLLGWYLARGIVEIRLSNSGLAILLTGFVGSQICLVASPWWHHLTGDSFSLVNSTFAFSILLWLGVLLFYLASFRPQIHGPFVARAVNKHDRRRPDKNQPLV